MSDQFIPFQSFSDSELANDFVEKLEQNEIDYEIENVRKILDSTIAGVSSDPDIIIKLRPEDFTKARHRLEDYYKSQIGNIDKDYYLFSFTNEELFEIISKPDEWNSFDFVFAQKLLAERGQKVDASFLEILKSNRKKELSKLEQPGFFLYFIAYLFILAGLLSFISSTFNYYDLNYLTTLFGFFIGRHIYRSKKTLPDGQTLFSYSQKDKNHGKILMYLGLVIFICCVLKQLILSFLINN